MRRWRFFIILIVLIGGLAALYASVRTGLIPERYNPLSPLNPAEEPSSITGWKLWVMGDDLPACIAAFRQAGVAVKQMPPRTERSGCAREDTITIGKFSRAAIAPEEMRCDVALRLYLLERHVIQPAARKHLGASVSRIMHFGSYSCRNISGSNRLSEHATANAFDISGFALSNGQTISLKRDWTSDVAPAAFLRDVRIGACDFFNMVLSPDYNEAHADHFHVDIGLFRGCN